MIMLYGAYYALLNSMIVYICMILYGTYLHCAIFLFNKLHFRQRIGEILGVDTYHTLYYNRGIDGEWQIHLMFAD